MRRSPGEAQRPTKTGVRGQSPRPTQGPWDPGHGAWGHSAAPGLAFSCRLAWPSSHLDNAIHAKIFGPNGP